MSENMSKIMPQKDGGVIICHDPQSIFDKALQFEVNQNSKVAKVQQQPRINTTQVKTRQ